jgi:hypothetical protein
MKTAILGGLVVLLTGCGLAQLQRATERLDRIQAAQREGRSALLEAESIIQAGGVNATPELRARVAELAAQAAGREGDIRLARETAEIAAAKATRQEEIMGSAWSAVQFALAVLLGGGSLAGVSRFRRNGKTPAGQAAPA